MQVCTLLQTDNHASTPPLSFFTGRMPFLLPNQQRQSTEGQSKLYHQNIYICWYVRFRWHQSDVMSIFRRQQRFFSAVFADRKCLQWFDAVGWAAGRASGL